MRLIGFEREDEAEQWARWHLEIDAPPRLFRAISAVDAAEDFVCVVVLTNFTSRNVDMNIVIRDKNAFRPKAMVEMFNFIFCYVFDRLGAVRATGLVRGKNLASKLICEHFGFKQEGIMRQSFENDDLHIYGFLADEYRTHKWYRG